MEILILFLILPAIFAQRYPKHPDPNDEPFLPIHPVFPYDPKLMKRGTGQDIFTKLKPVLYGPNADIYRGGFQGGQKDSYYPSYNPYQKLSTPPSTHYGSSPLLNYASNHYSLHSNPYDVSSYTSIPFSASPHANTPYPNSPNSFNSYSNNVPPSSPHADSPQLGSFYPSSPYPGSYSNFYQQPYLPSSYYNHPYAPSYPTSVSSRLPRLNRPNSEDTSKKREKEKKPETPTSKPEDNTESNQNDVNTSQSGTNNQNVHDPNCISSKHKDQFTEPNVKKLPNSYSHLKYLEDASIRKILSLPRITYRVISVAGEAVEPNYPLPSSYREAEKLQFALTQSLLETSANTSVTSLPLANGQGDISNTLPNALGKPADEQLSNQIPVEVLNGGSYSFVLNPQPKMMNGPVVNTIQRTPETMNGGPLNSADQAVVEKMMKPPPKMMNGIVVNTIQRTPETMNCATIDSADQAIVQERKKPPPKMMDGLVVNTIQQIPETMNGGPLNSADQAVVEEMIKPPPKMMDGIVFNTILRTLETMNGGPVNSADQGVVPEKSNPPQKMMDGLVFNAVERTLETMNGGPLNSAAQVVVEERINPLPKMMDGLVFNTVQRTPETMNCGPLNSADQAAVQERMKDSEIYFVDEDTSGDNADHQGFENPASSPELPTMGSEVSDAQEPVTKVTMAESQGIPPTTGPNEELRNSSRFGGYDVQSPSVRHAYQFAISKALPYKLGQNYVLKTRRPPFSYQNQKIQVQVPRSHIYKFTNYYPSVSTQQVTQQLKTSLDDVNFDTKQSTKG